MTLDQSNHTEDDETPETEEGPTSLRDDVMEVASDANVDMAQRLLRAFGMWELARETAKKENKKAADALAGKTAQFAEAMHVGHSTEDDQILKLSVVEQRWQDLEDARGAKKAIAAACKDTIKSAEARIKDLLEEAKSGQLTLFARPETPTPEE